MKCGAKNFTESEAEIIFKLNSGKKTTSWKATLKFSA